MLLNCHLVNTMMGKNEKAANQAVAGVAAIGFGIAFDFGLRSSLILAIARTAASRIQVWIFKLGKTCAITVFHTLHLILYGSP